MTGLEYRDYANARRPDAYFDSIGRRLYARHCFFLAINYTEIWSALFNWIAASQGLSSDADSPKTLQRAHLRCDTQFIQQYLKKGPKKNRHSLFLMKLLIITHAESHLALPSPDIDCRLGR